MSTCSKHPLEERLEVTEGTWICVACEAEQEDRDWLEGKERPGLSVGRLIVPVLADYKALAEELRPVTFRFSSRDRERAKVLAKAQGIRSYQAYIKKLISEGLERDEARFFGTQGT